MKGDLWPAPVVGGPLIAVPTPQPAEAAGRRPAAGSGRTLFLTIRSAKRAPAAAGVAGNGYRGPGAQVEFTGFNALDRAPIAYELPRN